MSAYLLSAGFETSEGYSDSSDGSDEALVTGYLGHNGNQQGWYGEHDYDEFFDTQLGVVSDDYAHSGTQALKLPLDDYVYDHYRHPLAEKTGGFTTFEWYQFLENVDPNDYAATNNVTVQFQDRFDGPNTVGNIGNEYATEGPGPFWASRSAITANANNPNAENEYDVYYAGPGWVRHEYPGVGPSAWVGIRAVIDHTAETFDVLYDVGGGGFVLYFDDVGLARINTSTGAGVFVTYPG